MLRDRPYVEPKWCERALREPERRDVQPDGRIRHWVFVEEVSPGVVLDLDASGRVVGIEVQHAGDLLDLSRVEFVPFGRLKPGAIGPLT